MNVSDVQRFLRTIGDVFGKKPEVERMCGALDPFAKETLAKFTDFLNAVSGEFVRSGMVSLPSSGKSSSRRPGTAKQKAFTKDDAAEIQNAVSRLNSLCNRATDPSLQFAEIKAETDRLGKEFDKGGLMAVAIKFGITERLSSKGAAQKKIGEKIAGRKGTVDLVETISPSATPVTVEVDDSE